MRTETPRLDPLRDDALDADIRERFGDGPILNIFRTIAHHPKLLSRWLVFGNHILQKSSLDPREREILILRIGWLCRAGYEWGQHVVIAKRSGLDDGDIERIADGPSAEGWSPRERALLSATDELHADAFVSDSTWKALSEHYDEKQLLDILFTVGQYNMVSMVLNSLGVQPEPGAPTLPER
jgi:4-carboxymuconolactone decarboxylase